MENQDPRLTNYSISYTKEAPVDKILIDISDDFKYTALCTPFENYIVSLTSYEEHDGTKRQEYFQSGLWWLEGKKVHYVLQATPKGADPEYFFVCSSHDVDDRLCLLNSSCSDFELSLSRNVEVSTTKVFDMIWEESSNSGEATLHLLSKCDQRFLFDKIKTTRGSRDSKQQS